MGGKLYAAKKFLGRHVSVMGKVCRGEKRGRMLGFPTANIIPENAVIPPVGVYAVRVIIGNKKFNGMANIGKRPSFNRNGGKVNIEVHLFSFNKDLYNKVIIIEFVKKIRNERVFDAKEKLIAQLKRDQIKTQSILK